MFVDGISQLIAANAVIKTALGVPRTDGTTGIYPNTAPDEVTLPYMVYMQISRQTINSFGGVNSLQYAHFRFFCYGASYRQAKVLAEDLKLLLDGFKGVLPDGTNLQNTIPGIEVDGSEPVFHATVYETSVDYSFTFIDSGS